MNMAIDNPKWWRYLSTVLVILTLCDVVLCLFTSWAIKAESLGKYDFGVSIGFTILFTYSFVILLGLVLMPVIGVIMGVALKYPVSKYVIMLAISLVLVIYLNAYS